MKYWICADCGNRHGHYRGGTTTWHEGHCDWCDQAKAVTSARDYGWPK